MSNRTFQCSQNNFSAIFQTIGYNPITPVKTCIDANIELCHHCKRQQSKYCEILKYKKLFELYEKTDLFDLIRRHVKDAIYIRSAINLYYPDFSNEIEKYCVLL